MNILRFIALSALACRLAMPSFADDAGALDGKKIAFLGDSITQAGQYVGFTAYYLEKLLPKQAFDIYGLGLSSETLSGLSEEGHAGGKFLRPCLFERLGRLLERVKPDVVFACYGINDGLYQPLDDARFAAFRDGVTHLIAQCQAGGVKQIYLVTPPIFDTTTKPGEFNYDSVLSEYAAWERTLNVPGVRVIDLHSAMRMARDARSDAFSKDRIHPGEEGHLLMARTILGGIGVTVPEESIEAIKADPLFKLIEDKRCLRSAGWMKHIGYTREKTVPPQPLGATEDEAAGLQGKIDALQR